MIGVRGVRSMVSHTCVRYFDSHVKGDKCVRGVRSVRGVGSVRVLHTCVSTHLGRGLARCLG